MIRLGVFDLDGTLLTSKDRLPDTFYEDVQLLRSRNVSVAIASARPAQILFDMFDRDVDLLISGEDENIFYRGRQLLHVRYISPEMAARIYDITSKRDDIAIVCSGPEAKHLSAEHFNRFFKWEKRFFLPVSFLQ